MGISVEQWRSSIGLFNKITFSNNFSNEVMESFLIYNEFSKILNILGTPIKILICILLLFSYYCMTVMLFPLFILLHHFFEQVKLTFLSGSLANPNPSLNLTLSTIQIFLKTNEVPSNISCALKLC